MLLLKALILLCVYAYANSQFFPNECPQLAPHDPPSDVRHLRADDLSLVMAIGDSIVSLIIKIKIFYLYIFSLPDCCFRRERYGLC